MPIKHLKKRTYGYLVERKNKLRKARGEADQKSPKRRRFLHWLLAIMVAGMFSLTVFTLVISKDLPDPDKLTDRSVAQSTKIYDRTGEHLLYEIYADERRTIIELDQIPKHLINGVVATEDTKFYEHYGIRPLSILRALFYGIFTNQRIAGTSTLTQQLVKNAILTDERSLTRKAKEAILSVRLEQKYSKEQILKIYFNEIPYGSTNYGVEAAAQSYFGKKASELNLAESATLAGIPKAPTTYLNDQEKLKTRRDFVLRRMFEEGYITEKEKTDAQAEPLELKQRFTDIKAPHFVLYTRELLVKQFGETLVDTGGLKVITTLDWGKQQLAEKTIKEMGDTVLKQAGGNNAALVSMEPKTGQILAMVGSRDFFDQKINGQFNVATLGRRQPGSSIKPIMYAAAFEKGYTPNTILYDVVTNFSIGGTPYIPKNYDLGERGPVTMRKALQGSLNIPAVKTLYLVGIDKAIEFSKRLGYSTFNKDTLGLSLVLGGGEVNMIEHTAAFGVFANNGVKPEENVTILKVEDPRGEILYEWKNKKGKQVITPELAALMSNVLSDDASRAYVFGANSVLTLPGRPAAAKTGTTNAYVDAWTVGYTPQLVTGVWAGNTDNSPMKAGFGGSMVAGKIWHEYMKEAMKNEAVVGFPAPPPIKANKPVLNGAAGGSVTAKVNKVTGRLANSSTPQEYIVERTYLLPHSILHYVDKDDPLGPAPKNPENDPQYKVWEQAIQNWIGRRRSENPNWEVSFEEPPTEYDDAFVLEMLPSLSIVYPAPSSTLVSRQIDTDIRVTAPSGVKKVKYQIDGVYVGVEEDHPFNLHYYASNLEPGNHTLTVSVEDDIGNQISQDISFTLAVGNPEPGIQFTNVPSNTAAQNFPLTLSVSPSKTDQIASIRIFAVPWSQEGDIVEITTINSFENLFEGKLIVKWNTAPAPGKWVIKTEITKKDGTTLFGDAVNITVK